MPRKTNAAGARYWECHDGVLQGPAEQAHPNQEAKLFPPAVSLQQPQSAKLKVRPAGKGK